MNSYTWTSSKFQHELHNESTLSNSDGCVTRINRAAQVERLNVADHQQPWALDADSSSSRNIILITKNSAHGLCTRTVLMNQPNNILVTCSPQQHHAVGLNKNTIQYSFRGLGLIIVRVRVLPFKPNKKIIPNKLSPTFVAATRPEKR